MYLIKHSYNFTYKQYVCIYIYIYIYIYKLYNITKIDNIQII